DVIELDRTAVVRLRKNDPVAVLPRERLALLAQHAIEAVDRTLHALLVVADPPQGCQLPHDRLAARIKRDMRPLAVGQRAAAEALAVPAERALQLDDVLGPAHDKPARGRASDLVHAVEHEIRHELARM